VRRWWIRHIPTRWLRERVRIDGRKGGLIECEGVLDPNTQPQHPDALAHSRTIMERAAAQPRPSTGCPVASLLSARRPRLLKLRIRLPGEGAPNRTCFLNHMNNEAHWSRREAYLSATPQLLNARCG